VKSEITFISGRRYILWQKQLNFKEIPSGKSTLKKFKE
jgi:hypothetical protein